MLKPLRRKSGIYAAGLRSGGRAAVLLRAGGGAGCPRTFFHYLPMVFRIFFVILQYLFGS